MQKFLTPTLHLCLNLGNAKKIAYHHLLNDVCRHSLWILNQYDGVWIVSHIQNGLVKICNLVFSYGLDKRNTPPHFPSGFPKIYRSAFVFKNVPGLFVRVWPMEEIVFWQNESVRKKNVGVGCWWSRIFFFKKSFENTALAHMHALAHKTTYLKIVLLIEWWEYKIMFLLLDII